MCSAHAELKENEDTDKSSKQALRDTRRGMEISHSRYDIKANKSKIAAAVGDRNKDMKNSQKRRKEDTHLELEDRKHVIRLRIGNTDLIKHCN